MAVGDQPPYERAEAVAKAKVQALEDSLQVAAQSKHEATS